MSLPTSPQNFYDFLNIQNIFMPITSKVMSNPIISSKDQSQDEHEKHPQVQFIHETHEGRKF